MAANSVMASLDWMLMIFSFYEDGLGFPYIHVNQGFASYFAELRIAGTGSRLVYSDSGAHDFDSP